MYLLLKKQWTLLCYALSFFSRVPVPSSINYSAFPFHLGNAYLPVVGVFSAFISCVVYFLAQIVFDPTISIIAMLIAGVIFTGAFHEDGFADVCDGFGGGYNKQQRLNIMKDSQIGTYGAVGLILLIVLKVSVLVELAAQENGLFINALISAAVLSRFSALCLMQSSDYARENEGSKSTQSSHRLPTYYFLLSALFSMLTFYWMPLYWIALIAFVTVISTILWRTYFYKHIGGYSGDCLGFLQQVNELFILLSFVAILGW